MTTHSEALKAKAEKAVGQVYATAYHYHCSEEMMRLGANIYLRATDDALAVIEAERIRRGIEDKLQMAISLGVVASKIRNPEPELPISVREACKVLRGVSMDINGMHVGYEADANALESAARKGGWR